MARLPRGGKQRRKGRILRLLRGSYGVHEVEVADDLDVHRRTANNYLRELDDEGKAHKKGRKWYSD